MKANNNNNNKMNNISGELTGGTEIMSQDIKLF